MGTVGTMLAGGLTVACVPVVGGLLVAEVATDAEDGGRSVIEMPTGDVAAREVVATEAACEASPRAVPVWASAGPP